VNPAEIWWCNCNHAVNVIVIAPAFSQYHHHPSSIYSYSFLSLLSSTYTIYVYIYNNINKKRRKRAGREGAGNKTNKKMDIEKTQGKFLLHLPCHYSYMMALHIHPLITPPFLSSNST
jgi:hypothetical protein